jgi:hypothetical protein
MKFTYNYNKLAMSTVLNMSFSAPHADANVIKFLESHCGASSGMDNMDGIQCCVLLKSLYDHITDNICRNIERISNRVFNWKWNVMNKEFIIVIQFGNNKTLLRKIMTLIAKSLQPQKLWPVYSDICKIAKCDTNQDDFKFRVSALRKHILDATISVSGKININDKDFQSMMKEQEKKVNMPDMKGKELKKAMMNSDLLKLSLNSINVNNAYASVIMDHLHSRKVSCKWIGEEIYICGGKSINKHFAENLVEARAKKYAKLKDHFKHAMTHDMLASGIPPSLIKSVTLAELTNVMGKYN